MKDLKITKGEWHTGNYVPNLICTDQFEQSVAIAQWDGTLITKDEAIANAKLIAAAPELLMALQKLLLKYDFNLNATQAKNKHLDDERINAIKAIEKATE